MVGLGGAISQNLADTVNLMRNLEELTRVYEEVRARVLEAAGRPVEEQHVVMAACASCKVSDWDLNCERGYMTAQSASLVEKIQAMKQMLMAKPRLAAPAAAPPPAEAKKKQVEEEYSLPDDLEEEILFSTPF